MPDNKKHHKHADKVKAGSPEPIVIFVASSTPEKIRDFQLIAEAKKYPIIFEDINKLLGAFHHADEVSSDYKANAGDKLKSVDISGFRNGDYTKRVVNYLRDRDLSATTKMFIATEDGGFSLEKDIWDKVNKDGIPREVLERIKPNKNPNFSGPGVETAPVISSMLGEYNFMQRVQKAVSDLGRDGQDITMLQNAVISLTPIDVGSTAEKEIFNAEKITYLHTPDHHSMKKSFTENEHKISNYHYSKPHNGNGRSIIELGKEGITEHGVRAELADKVYAEFFEKEIKSGHKPNYHHPYKNKVSGEAYRIGAFDSAGTQAMIDKIARLDKGRRLGAGFAITIPDGAYIGDKGHTSKTLPQSSYDILSNIEKTLANSDSVVLFPDMLEHRKKPETPEEIEREKLAQLTKLYTLFSLVVDKQLNARDAKKPIIIMNHDGSWNDAIAIHNNLANIGMTKEHTINLPTRFNNTHGVDIQSNSYYDVVGTPKNGKHYTYQQTADAVIEILKEKRKGYNLRPASHSAKSWNGKDPQDFDGYKVAVFCSASNENKYLNEAVKDMSYHLAKDKFGIIYGGGDRYTMGAVLEGVKKHRKELMTIDGLSEEDAKKKTYIAGYSTKQILKSETTKSAFSPDLNYSKQNTNIYQRMADMLENSDAVVAAPGGAGTVQEWTAALILNHLRPKEEKKPIVFYNPKLNVEQTQVWNVALKAVLGEKDYNLLTSETASPSKREERSKELGIYVETTESAVQKRISELRKEHELHKKHSHVESYLNRSSHADGITLH